MNVITDTDIRKLFVGGLSWETTKETLQNYFSQFGEVVDSVVMKNNETGRSRGFGFVTFKDPNCVNAVLQSRPHEINGRTVDAKERTPRSMQRNKKAATQGKVFLGGLPPDITETDIHNLLSQFGKVDAKEHTPRSMQRNKKAATQGKVFLGGLPPDITETDIRSSLSQFGKVDAKEHTPRSMQRNKKAATQGKVFLGGLPPDITETDIHNLLSQFGKVNQVTTCVTRKQKNAEVECQRAEPRDTNQRRNPAQAYGSGNQNGMMRPGGYGPAPGYQAGWNQPAQPYGMQGQGYGNYQNYNAMGGNSYSAGTAPYSAMPPSTQYAAQPSYPGYGAVGHGYTRPPAAGNYSRPAATGYSQAPAASYSPTAGAAPDAC